MTHVEGKHRVWWALCVFLALSSVAVAAFAQPVQGGSGAPLATSGVVGIIVKLEDDPVVSYRGTVAGLPATSPQVTGAARFNDRATPVQAYRAYLDRKHAAFEATATAVIPGARVTYRYETVLGGIAMRVPADQLARVAQLPGVKAVYRDRLLKLHTDKSPTFITAKPLWTKLGGQDEAGEGVVVGILDTGIWPEHPSFSDPDPMGKPYAAATASHAALQCQFGRREPRTMRSPAITS